MKTRIIFKIIVIFVVFVVKAVSRMFYTALLLLPAVAYAQISIRVFADIFGDQKNYNIDLIGSATGRISDAERRTWKISDTGIYVSDPTAWGDLYKKFYWRRVHRTLTPRTAKINSIDYEPVILGTQEFLNNSTKTITYYPGMSRPVEETIYKTWYISDELTIRMDISYTFDIVTLNGTASISFTGPWGKDTRGYYTKVTQLVKCGDPKTLKPGESIVSVLRATKVVMYVRVDYTAVIEGMIVVAQNQDARPYIFLPVKGTPIDSYEVIRVELYLDAKTLVYGKGYGQKVLEGPARNPGQKFE